MNWQDYDFESTVRAFEYTKRAASGINEVIDSKHFADMDASMIFDYLSKKMEVVLFPDYLKRYLYQKLGMTEEFASIPNEVYQRIISDSLDANRAPYSFTPTTTKKNAMIKLWLTQPNVKRSVIFVLGFALRMTDPEVSEFLTKVIKEEDFDFSDPFETVCWYCYNNDLPYGRCMAYMRQYEEMGASNVASHDASNGVSNAAPLKPVSDNKWKTMRSSARVFLLSEQNLFTYLTALKSREVAEEKEKRAFGEFMDLYERCREIIRDEYNAAGKNGEEGAKDKVWETVDIKPADLEKALCSGIPVNSSNNLSPMSASKFAGLFRNKRMSRQRISGILSRKHPVERFDLISLLFYIYAETVEPDWPAERYIKFIDEINERLERCGMMGIYPANPYEAFVLMCVVTDFPLDVYSQVWEMSYGDVPKGL